MFEIYRYASHHLCLDRDDEAVTACEISNHVTICPLNEANRWNMAEFFRTLERVSVPGCQQYQVILVLIIPAPITSWYKIITPVQSWSPAEKFGGWSQCHALVTTRSKLLVRCLNLALRPKKAKTQQPVPVDARLHPGPLAPPPPSRAPNVRDRQAPPERSNGWIRLLKLRPCASRRGRRLEK